MIILKYVFKCLRYMQKREKLRMFLRQLYVYVYIIYVYLCVKKLKG
jgi:hypothetical protein